MPNFTQTLCLITKNLKKELSSRTSVFKRKFFLSWFIPLVAGLITFLAFDGKFWSLILFGLALAVGIFYAGLKRMYFTEECLIVDNNEIPFKDIVKFNPIELNLYVFLTFKVKINGKTKWYWTDPGNAGLMVILAGIFLGKKNPYANMQEFIILMKKAKKN